MVIPLSVEIIIIIIILAFLCEYIDSTLGMGYGTTLTPILLILNFDPLQIVPAVLLSEFVTGITAAAFHHKANNIRFKRASIESKIATILSVCSIIGTLIAIFLSLNISKFLLKSYIATMVIIMGLVIVATNGKTISFSWNRITTLGIIASFNKGMSGGGYGPVVTGGQIMSGVDAKHAIAITSLAEGLTCLTGITAYLILTPINWSLSPFLIIGALISTPISAFSVKKLNTKKIRMLIGITTLSLGIYTAVKLFV